MNSQLNKAVRQRLADVIRKSGMKNYYFAHRLGMTQDSFSHWKAGRYDFSRDRLKKLDKVIDDVVLGGWFE